MAVVGPSGAGISTLARLLYRFYEADEGCGRIDGQNVRDVTRESLRGQIGVVSLDTLLFNDTLTYHIAYGRLGASEADIVRAVRMAHLDTFVVQGYDTIVGERGLSSRAAKSSVSPSPGRLSSTRPFSSSSKRLRAWILTRNSRFWRPCQALAADRTGLVNAHRLSTAVDAYATVVLEGGRIAEYGIHFELFAAGGLYARLWANQQREAEEREGDDHKEVVGP